MTLLSSECISAQQGRNTRFGPRCPQGAPPGTPQNPVDRYSMHWRARPPNLVFHSPSLPYWSNSSLVRDGRPQQVHPLESVSGVKRGVISRPYEPYIMPVNSGGHRNVSASLSDGVIQPRVCRGRPLSECAAWSRWCWVSRLMLVPLCHGDWGSQK